MTHALSALALVLVLIGLAACGGGVSSLDQSGDIKVATEQNVTNCETLGDIHGFKSLPISTRPDSA